MEDARKPKPKKISLTTIGLVLLIALAAANLYGWKARANSEAQIADLNGQISGVQARAGAIMEPPSDLDARLAAAKDRLAAAQAGFPETVDRNDVINFILETAGECEVAILPLESDGWSLQDIGQSYNVLIINAAAEGSLSSVNALVDKLQHGRFPTLTVPEYDIKRTGAALTAGDPADITVTADLRICIYAYTPVPEGKAKK